MHVLDGYAGEYEGEEVGEESRILNTSKGGEGGLFAIDSRGRRPFVLKRFVLGFTTIADSDPEDSESKIGVDCFFISAHVEFEQALSFGDHTIMH